jgi:glutaredoxin 3
MTAKIEFFYRDFCPFCSQAEQILKSKNIKFEAINIWEDPSRKADMVKRSGGKSTVPQIFVNDQYLGDCDHITRLEMSGKLDEALGIS